MDDYSGTWLIGNPDRGEIIPDSASRLVIGGAYHISSPDKSVLAEIRMRDREGIQTRIRRTGTIFDYGSGALGMRFTDGVQEVMVFRDDGQLDRLFTTSSTIEDGLTLAPVEDFDEASQPNLSTIPPMLLNTMPKSGSIYISRALAQGLGISEMKIGVCLFPNDLVIREKLDAFAIGHTVAQQHLPASDINVRFIAARLERMVVHVRDPRQATLSWLHHIDNFHAQRLTEPDCQLGLEALYPQLPDGYFDLQETEKLDHLIDTHYRQLIDWSEGWLAAAQSDNIGLDIKFTRYEDFLADEKAFLTDLLKFYKIPPAEFDWSKLPDKTEQTHFRKGLTDEWKTVFSASQKERCAEMISSSLAEAFDWKND